jgi:RNA polymerase sigma factor (sigma-70 family)
MTEKPLSRALRHIRRLIRLPPATDLADGALLARFVAQRDEAAFAELVQRYGPLVLGLCRRVLCDADDADDAFQATFMVLARQAAVIRKQGSVGSWLYGVAYRVAMKMKISAARRRAGGTDRMASRLPTTGSGTDLGQLPDPSSRQNDPGEAAARRELRQALDEEILRLPAKYRQPLVLCDLQGLHHEEAARQLGCPSGSISRYLTRARELLQERLTHRGLALSGGLVAAVLAEDTALSAKLAETTVQAAVQFKAGSAAAGISPAAVIAAGVVKTMKLTRLTLVASLLLTLGAIGTGAGLWAYQTLAGAAEKAAAPIDVARAEPERAPQEEAGKKEPPVQLPPLPEEKTAPWGKEVDGLSCRIVVPAEVTHGQPIRMTIQVRNTSKRTRYLCAVVSPRAKALSALAVTGPDGKALTLNMWHEGASVDPRNYPALAPGENRRFEVADIRALFSGGAMKDGDYICTDSFARDGQYKLAYTFRSLKCPERVVIGSQGNEPLYAEATKEQLAGAFEGSLQAAPISINVRPLKPEDLDVHEWGVFTVFSDVKHANVNRKAEWTSLPGDFYRQFPERRLVCQPGEWLKPIINFYTKQPSLEIGVKVKFNEGAPVVWWPACASPVESASRHAVADGPPKVFDTLRWSGWLGDVLPNTDQLEPFGDRPEGRWTKVQQFELPRTGWLKDARLPGAARFTVSYLEQNGPMLTTRSETERFIFYDGLVPAPDFLRCTGVTDMSVTVKNTASFPISQLFFIDRRVERKNKDWALAYRAEAIPAGGEATIPLQAVRAAKNAASEDLTKLVRAVRHSLLSAGLFDAEADSILKIWHKDFFAMNGLTAFFLLPQAEYDQMLPLEVTPAPANRPVRVGITHHPHFEMGPRVRERVAQLIQQLDSNNFNARDAASRELEELGPWAVPLIREAIAKKPTLEATRRLEAILQKADASEWLKQTVEPAKKSGK